MADNISDKSGSSEEEEEEEPSGLSIRPASRSSIIFSRPEEHQADSEKVDHQPFILRPRERDTLFHIWTVGPGSGNSILAGFQFKHKCAP